MSDDDFRVTRIRPGASRAPSQNEALARLEETVRRFFSGGGKGGGGNGSGPRSSGGGAGNSGTGRLLVIAFGVIIALWGVLSSYYTIDISEDGVVTRFGAYVRTTPPGMHFKLPFGIENVIKVEAKRILQEEFGFRTRDVTGERSTYDKEQYVSESLMLTGDLNVADVEWILQFRISDPWKYLFHARDVRHNIRDVSLSIMRRVVGDRLVGDVLTTGRVEIADEAKLLTQDVLDEYDMGITIEKIILQGVNPPEKVKPAFNEVNSAMQEQEQTINNAERDYNKVIPAAKGKADQVQADAEAYAIDTVNRAKGDTALFAGVMAEYQKAPAITKMRIYLETMEEVFTKAPEITIVDSAVKGLLPVFQQAQQQAPTPQPAAK